MSDSRFRDLSSRFLRRNHPLRNHSWRSVNIEHNLKTASICRRVSPTALTTLHFNPRVTKHGRPSRRQLELRKSFTAPCPAIVFCRRVRSRGIHVHVDGRCRGANRPQLFPALGNPIYGARNAFVKSRSGPVRRRAKMKLLLHVPRFRRRYFSFTLAWR